VIGGARPRIKGRRQPIAVTSPVDLMIHHRLGGRAELRFRRNFAWVAFASILLSIAMSRAVGKSASATGLVKDNTDWNG
jgi:hypothetical protein